MCHPAILLHRAKADLTLLDENRNTALHLACSKVHTHTITQRILKSKLSINTVPTEYSSSLISNDFTLDSDILSAFVLSLRLMRCVPC